MNRCGSLAVNCAVLRPRFFGIFHSVAYRHTVINDYGSVLPHRNRFCELFSHQGSIHCSACQTGKILSNQALLATGFSRWQFGLRTFSLSSSRCAGLGDKESGEEDVQGSEELDDEFLNDRKYAELFTETYLLPISGNRIYAIQPNLKFLPKATKITSVDLQLAELCSLVETLPKWTVVEREVYSLKAMDKRFVFGKGNLAEIGQKIRRLPGVTGVVLGLNMLNGLQLANLQDNWGVAVYDRYTLVLQIFKIRARTKEAKLQLALAEIPYYRSRLTGMHSGSLERQRGGMNFVGGSGERYFEVRQRLLQEREQKIRTELQKLRSQRSVLRGNRKRNDFPIVAVVGYTNAGKTSLIKSLTGDSSMEPRDQLFATLDVTVHAGDLPNRMKVMFIDTVGFISDIPTSLVESFSATLEDIVNADLLVHIRDVSHPDSAAQKIIVLRTLRELHLPPSLLENMIEVCNKTDLLDSGSLDELKRDGQCFAVSVKKGSGLLELRHRIQELILSTTGRVTKRLKIPTSGPHLAWLYKEATVESTRCDESDPEKLLVDVVMTDASYSRFLSRFGRKKIQNTGAPFSD